MDPLDVETNAVEAKQVDRVRSAVDDNASPAASPQPHRVIDLTPFFGDDADLPTNVTTLEQLDELPDDLKSGNPLKPLQHIDEGAMDDDDSEDVSEAYYTYQYSLQPMTYAVIFILVVELLERFSYYGIVYTETSYLTGSYNPDWNAGFTAVTASSYVSVSSAIAYTTPFFGSILADSFCGEYWVILCGTLFFYLPSIALLVMTTIPNPSDDDDDPYDNFNHAALAFALLVLWPIGTGTVKACVNVFGAKQFHPLLQSSLIERYYVTFYMCINIGSMCGGILIPIVAQHSVTIAYMIPAAGLALGVICFVATSSRFTMTKPSRAKRISIGSMCNSVADMCPKLELNKNSKFSFAEGVYPEKTAFMAFTPTIKPKSQLSLSSVFKVCALIIPFNIGYSQMATTFVVQGTVMRPAVSGLMDAASMNNCDAVSVLLFGYIIGQQLYPWLAMRDIKICTTHKFALGSLFGAMSLLWALVVEHKIHSAYAQDGVAISILWQVPSYVLIGCGEIFAISTAYETAFTAAPPQRKALASALNIFCVGGLPNVVCIGLYNVCAQWFEASDGTSNIHSLERYSEAHIYKYFFVLFVIAVGGVVLNLLPCVRRFVERLEELAVESIKTPRGTPRIGTPSMTPQKAKQRREARRLAETAPLLLLPSKKHQAYLKYGSNPTLYRSGSMRAGSTLHKTGDESTKKLLAKSRKFYSEKHKQPRNKVVAPPVKRQSSMG
jgi:POT family proton-dependent oligopeptide transporter